MRSVMCMLRLLPSLLPLLQLLAASSPAAAAPPPYWLRDALRACPAAKPERSRVKALISCIRAERSGQKRDLLARVLARTPLTDAADRHLALQLLLPASPREVRSALAWGLLAGQPASLATAMLKVTLALADSDADVEIRRRALMGMRDAPRRTSDAVCPVAARAARVKSILEADAGSDVLSSAVDAAGKLRCARELSQLFSFLERRASRPAKRYLGGPLMGTYALCAGKHGRRWQRRCMALMRKLLANRRRYDWTRGEAANRLAKFAKHPKRELRRYVDDLVRPVARAAMSVVDPPLGVARRFAWAVLEAKPYRARSLLLHASRYVVSRLRNLRPAVAYQVLRVPPTPVRARRKTTSRVCEPLCPHRSRCLPRCRQAAVIEITFAVARFAHSPRTYLLVVRVTDDNVPRILQAKRQAPNYRVLGWRWQ
ncbi:MAG: hypothetical protein KC503_20400 [Myxococcales bacterium]|nr:hypothetical protein [Myxococcales bacterium]